MLGALLSICSGLMMPTFTYKTMVTPEVGPDNNGVRYGSGKDTNQMSEFFYAKMPADRLMGKVAESLRQHPRARRSSHPILSFSGIDVDDAIDAQSLDDPLAPIGKLLEAGGYVLMAGVDHTTNTSIHYAEKLAGRKRFVRWALTPQGVVTCPGFPGSSEGFEQINADLELETSQVMVGSARVRAVPLDVLIKTALDLIAKDPLALLPEESSDERVHAVREEVATGH